MLKINEGSYFILRDNKGTKKILKAAPRIIHHQQNCNIDLRGLIGQPFDAIYEVTDRKEGIIRQITDLAEMQAHLLVDELALEDEDLMGEPKKPEDEKMEEGQRKDNREIVDDNLAQNLTYEEIEHLKETDKDGKAIINALIQNSDTFSKRTKFS
jgi:tRNA (adenine-N(1)-)-methyltransferase non-catalytic subunit